MELGRNQYVVSLELGIFQGQPKSIRPNSETVKIRPMAQEADSTHFRSPVAKHRFASRYHVYSIAVETHSFKKYFKNLRLVKKFQDQEQEVLYLDEESGNRSDFKNEKHS